MKKRLEQLKEAKQPLQLLFDRDLGVVDILSGFELLKLESLYNLKEVDDDGVMFRVDAATKGTIQFIYLPFTSIRSIKYRA